jgi:NAD+ diphosphatase
MSPVFAKNSLDRMEHLRPSILDRLLGADPANRFLLVLSPGIVVRRADKAYLFSDADLPEMPQARKQAVFLGGREGKYYFALPVQSEPEATFERAGLREFVSQNLLPDVDTGLMAQAVSVLNWHATHNFCGFCGARTDMVNAGWRRDCKACGRQHFPRVDPVVIMLVTHGDHCLIGSGRNFRVPGLYSCLAGFMEPGETIEDAARRELFEEAGIKAGPVEYMCSQPWPFPSNLMIGVRMEALSMDTRMDEKELLDLKWVSKAEVQAVLNGAADLGFNLPSPVAIARNLLEVWVRPSSG